ncbi:MAG: EthD domain-containing protein [Acidimicrobiia bacterium]|nr:EthD domain-containing protein [Acidimicrobiia bacterium]
MIRLTFLLRRRSDLSPEEFRRYWFDEHGPLVASHQGHLAIKRYVQVHTLDDPFAEAAARARGGAMEEPYDGVAELWFDSEDEFRAAGAADAGRAAGRALLEDEAHFIDLARSPLWLAHEYPQVNPTPETVVASEWNGVVKLYFPLRHLPTLDLDGAQRYWRVQHGPLIRRQAPAAGILCYRQVHRYETPLEAALRDARGCEVEPYTGHAEAWFDRSIVRTGPEVRASGRRAVEDERNFIDFARSSIWLGKERVIVDRW